MKAIREYLSKAGMFKFALVIALISIIVKVPGTLIGDFVLEVLGLNYPPFSSDEQLPDLTLADFFLSVIIAPLLETLVGQSIPIKVVSKLTQSKIFIIATSALVFALMHLPVVGFLLGAFLVGWIFSWGYVLRAEQNNGKPFWTITLAHGLHNLIAVSLLALTLLFTSEM